MNVLKSALNLLPPNWHARPPAALSEIDEWKNALPTLPPSLWEYYLLSNGGEGSVQEIYLSFWEIAKLKKLNDEYGFQKYMHPNVFVIGTTDDAFIAFDGRSNKNGWSIFPFGDFDLDDICEISSSFSDLINSFEVGNFPARASTLLQRD